MPFTAVCVTYGPNAEFADLSASYRRTSPRQSVLTVVVQPDTSGASLGDGTLNAYPWVGAVRVDTNLGFGGANNRAVSRCTTDYVALLNPDIELTPGWWEPLVAELDANPDVAVAAPPLLDSEGYIAEAGQMIHADGGTEPIGGRQSPGWPHNYVDVMQDRDVPYASAACWMVRRSVFNELGGFEERYWPAYFEDADFCLRAAEAGYRTRLVCARPVIHHHEGASAERVAIAERSRAAFEKRWAGTLSTFPARANV